MISVRVTKKFLKSSKDKNVSLVLLRKNVSIEPNWSTKEPSGLHLNVWGCLHDFSYKTSYLSDLLALKVLKIK